MHRVSWWRACVRARVKAHCRRSGADCERECRLTLVGFSNTASQVLPLTSMDTDGRATAAAALEQLRPSGSTNLWGGVLAGLDALRTGDEGGGRHKSVLVLTDGVPNVQPPHGEVAELKEYFELHAAFASALQMNTFGFGYQLNSKLLLQLAESGNGTFAFIPDAVITGTVFVNSIANVCSCHTPQAFLSLAVGDDAAFAGPVLGDLRVAQTGRWQVVELGPLQWGQTRDVVVPLDIPAGDAPFLHASLTSTNPATGAQVRHATALGTQRTSSADAVLASLRAQTVFIGKRCLDQAESGDGKTAEAGMAQLCSMFEATPPRCTSSAGGLSPRTSLLAPLRADVQGRMSKALKGKKRFDRWVRPPPPPPPPPPPSPPPPPPPLPFFSALYCHVLAVSVPTPRAVSARRRRTARTGVHVHACCSLPA